MFAPDPEAEQPRRESLKRRDCLEQADHCGAHSVRRAFLDHARILEIVASVDSDDHLAPLALRDDRHASQSLPSRSAAGAFKFSPAAVVMVNRSRHWRRLRALPHVSHWSARLLFRRHSGCDLKLRREHRHRLPQLHARYRVLTRIDRRFAAKVEYVSIVHCAPAWRACAQAARANGPIRAAVVSASALDALPSASRFLTP